MYCVVWCLVRLCKMDFEEILKENKELDYIYKLPYEGTRFLAVQCESTAYRVISERSHRINQARLELDFMLNGIDSEYTDDVPQRKTQLQSINSETTELASNLQESTRDSLELQDAEEDRFDIKDLAVWYIRAAIHLLIGLFLLKDLLNQQE